jgi:uncharacterized protein DUF3237
MHKIDLTPRRFGGGVCAAAIVAAVVLAGGSVEVAGEGGSPPPTQTAPVEEKLQSELLFDLVLERGTATNVGSPGGNKVVVPVAAGTFDGPKLKGTVVAPSSDTITVRQDGSSVLDLRLLLQTDDGQKILMTCRGIAYTTPDGALFARLQPLFETGAEKYSWLNRVVAVGVYRPVPGKVAYRIYRIL